MRRLAGRTEVFVTVGVLVASNVAFSQGSDCCTDPFPTPPAAGDCPGAMLSGRSCAGAWTELFSIEERRQNKDWLRVQACDCRCVSQTEVNQCPSPSRSEAWTKRVCASVNVQVGATFGAGVFAFILEKLGFAPDAELSIEYGEEECDEHQRTETLQGAVSQCFNTATRFVVLSRDVSVKTYLGDTQYTWGCTDASGNLSEWHNYCGLASIQYSTGQYTYGLEQQHAPTVEACGGPPVASPDPWDGQRQTPCCPTAAPCPPDAKGRRCCMTYGIPHPLPSPCAPYGTPTP